MIVGIDLLEVALQLVLTNFALLRSPYSEHPHASLFVLFLRKRYAGLRSDLLLEVTVQETLESLAVTGRASVNKNLLSKLYQETKKFYFLYYDRGD